MPDFVMMALNIYIILAIAYNLISLVFDDIISKKLAPTDPINGTLIISVIYLWFSFATKIPLGVFAIGAITFIYIIGRFGVLKHYAGYSPETYHSRISWFAAIAINIFGVVVLFAYAIMVMF